MQGIREPYREVAAAMIIGTCGRLLFQQRDDIPGLLYAGMIGLFGGHREDGETSLVCVRRELEEELGLKLAAERFEPLAEFTISYPLGGGVKGAYYVVRDLPIGEVVVTEGTPLIAERSDLPGLLPRMTPTACLVTRLFMMMPAQSN
jgi:8-oxo-dGTP pyrophosphatase MutT (NUDIX family)